MVSMGFIPECTVMNKINRKKADLFGFNLLEIFKLLL
jgi:hypothetical protein